MPIAKFKMPDGSIARYSVPEGTTPEQAQQLFDADFANEKSPLRIAYQQKTKPVEAAPEAPALRQEERATGKAPGFEMAIQEAYRPLVSAIKEYGPGLAAGFAAPEVAALGLGRVGLNALSAAVRSGGLQALPELGAMRAAATRLAGGALAGGTGAAATGLVDTGQLSPEGTATGAVIGAAIPVVGGVVQKGAQVVRNIQNPEYQAFIKGAGDKIDDLISTLKQSEPVIPGTQPHAGIAAASVGSTNFSSMVKDLLDSPNVKKEIGDILASTEKTNDLARDLYSRGLFSSLEEAKNVLLTKVAPDAIPERALGSLQSRISSSEKALEKQGKKLGEELGTVSQAKTGENIAEARKAEIERVKQDVVNPAYAKALEDKTEFDVSLIGRTAKSIRKGAEEVVNPGLAPKTVEAMTLFSEKAPAVTEQVIDIGLKRPIKLAPKVEAAKPAMATLQDVDGLIKAINSDIASLRRSANPDAAKTMANLLELKKSAESAIIKGVPEKTQKAYAEARKVYRTELVEPYMKDWTVKLDRETSTGVPQLRANNVVDEILKDEVSAQQYAKGMGKNPEANKALSQGVEDIYKTKVLDPETGIPQMSKHAQFMRDNEKQFEALGSVGGEIKSKLNQYGQRIKALDNLRSALNETKKGFSYETPEAMIADFSKNYGKMQRAFGFMDADAKNQVARSILGNVMSGSADDIIRAAQSDKSLMLALKESNPKEYPKLLNDLKEHGEFLKLAQEGQNLLSPKFPEMANQLGAKARIEELTKNFTPSQKADFEKLRKEADMVKTFEELAKKGGKKGSSILSDAMEEADVGKKPIPGWFDRLATLSRHLFERFEGKVDREQALSLAKHMINPKMAAQFLEDAKAWKAAQDARSATVGKLGIGLQRAATIAPAAIMNQNALRSE